MTSRSVAPVADGPCALQTPNVCALSGTSANARAHLRDAIESSPATIGASLRRNLVEHSSPGLPRPQKQRHNNADERKCRALATGLHVGPGNPHQSYAESDIR